MTTSFKYIIFVLIMLLSCATQAVTLSPYNSDQPIFTSSSRMLHDNNNSKNQTSSTIGGINRYTPTSTLGTTFSGAAPSMTSMSTATCSFRSQTPVILAANDNHADQTMRRVGEGEHLPDPMLPVGDTPYFLILASVLVYIILRSKKVHKNVNSK